MSNLRIFWIAWCSAWALFWMLAGFFTFLLGWLMIPVSLAAILIPVGQGYQPRAVLPACVRCGNPAASHAGGQCPGAGATPQPSTQKNLEVP